MNGPRPAHLLRHLAGSDAEAPDRDLLHEYASTRDNGAFAELVRRHGPVVLAACRRGTFRREDAEDSFQAVFLILARRAGSVGQPELLGNWLYRVAVRVARDARRAAARRRVREVQVVDVPEPAAPPTPALHDLGPVLDEELAALPPLYRDAVVLCDLRGVSRADAAAQLGIPLGTLASRLDGGRKKLAARLTRRGVTLSVAEVMVEGRAVAVPEVLLTKTREVGATWSAGGTLPQAVLKLAQGGVQVRRMMFLGLVAASALAVVGLAQDAQPSAPPSTPPTPPAAEKKGEPGPIAVPGFEFRARPREALDLPVKDVRQATWTPDGERIVVVGPETVDPPARKGLPVAYSHSVFRFQDGAVTLDLPRSANLAGFVVGKNGPVAVTDLREFHLASGLHQLAFWSLRSNAPEGAIAGAPSRRHGPDRSVDVDPEPTRGYALAADGTSYRTLRNPAAKGGRVEVREVTLGPLQAEVKPLLAVPGGWGELTSDGRVLFVVEAAVVTAYEVPGGKKLWARAFARAEQHVEHVATSADGAVLAVTHSDFRVSTLNGRTGQVLPPLEGLDEVTVPRLGPQNFSAWGHLLGFCVYPLPELGPPRGSTIKVWNTRTGKLVKSWAGAPAVAFHPSRPMLALLEPNGDQTRFGLWDYDETAK